MLWRSPSYTQRLNNRPEKCGKTQKISVLRKKYRLNKFSTTVVLHYKSRRQGLSVWWESGRDMDFCTVPSSAKIWRSWSVWRPATCLMLLSCASVCAPSAEVRSRHHALSPSYVHFVQFPPVSTGIVYQSVQHQPRYILGSVLSLFRNCIRLWHFSSCWSVCASPCSISSQGTFQAPRSQSCLRVFCKLFYCCVSLRISSQDWDTLSAQCSLFLLICVGWVCMRGFVYEWVCWGLLHASCCSHLWCCPTFL